MVAQGVARGRPGHARLRVGDGCRGRRGPHRRIGRRGRRHPHRAGRRSRPSPLDPRARRRRTRRRGGDAPPAHARRRLPRPHRSQPPRGGGLARARRHPRARRRVTTESKEHTLMNTISPAATQAAAIERPAASARPTGFVRDTATVFARESRPLVRDPFSVVFSLVQPLVFLGLFGPLLVGASGGDVAATLQWFVPGILVMVALFGTASTGANLLFEMQTGSHERTLVAPLSRSALLVGRALKEVVPLVIQGTIVVLVAVPFGFRLDV